MTSIIMHILVQLSYLPVPWRFKQAFRFLIFQSVRCTFIEFLNGWKICSGVWKAVPEYYRYQLSCFMKANFNHTFTEHVGLELILLEQNTHLLQLYHLSSILHFSRKVMEAWCHWDRNVKYTHPYFNDLKIFLKPDNEKVLCIEFSSKWLICGAWKYSNLMMN